MHHPEALIPFSPDAIETFRRQVGAVLRDVGAEAAGGLLADASARLEAEAIEAFRPLGAALEQAGVRQRWNALLSRERAAALAAWVAPHLRGRVLDLLSGCGSVARELAAAGWDVMTTERRDAYSSYLQGRDAHDFAFEDGAEPLRSQHADTVLLCTVLHHEPDPAWLVEQATRVQARRLVIVENCIEDRFDESFHQLMDLFFNLCLNRIDIETPAQHRTPRAWMAFLRRFGRVRLIERRESMPGIPLGHHLFTVDLAPAATAAERREGAEHVR